MTEIWTKWEGEVISEVFPLAHFHAFWTQQQCGSPIALRTRGTISGKQGRFRGPCDNSSGTRIRNAMVVARDGSSSSGEATTARPRLA
jgi:hypothetical protein